MTTNAGAPGPKNPGAQDQPRRAPERSTPMLPPNDDNDFPHQIRRRRAAALRCQPLADGVRDPLDRADTTYWSDDRLRALANALVADGFSVEYIEHRYGIRPKIRPQHCPCSCQHQQGRAA
jgi:hypothetical protein